MGRASRRTLAAALAAAVVAGPAAAPANDVGAAIAAGVVGVALGAALANSHSHPHQNRFSPAAGIECYDRQRACYHSDGGFSANWTRRIYG